MSEPKTNPGIDGKPLSFVKLKSTVENNPLLSDRGRMVQGEYTDARGVPYVVKDGVVYRVRKEKTAADLGYRE